MEALDRVYLVPGFFGFANLGDLHYFGHVHRFLQERFAAEHVPVRLHEVKTRPTASLEQRAGALAETILATAGPKDRLHLIGHSSGGVDIRVLLTPGARLGEHDVPSVVARVKTAVTVSTPHYGTPSAEVFRSLAGRQLLKLLSLMTIVVVRRGALPLKLVLAIGKVLRRIERRVDPEVGMVDELYDALLGELTDERRNDVHGFFEQVGDDQSLLDQITPRAMALFNTTVPDAPNVRYGCVVTRARRPGLGTAVEIGLRPSAQASHALHAACHTLAGWEQEPRWLADEERARLRAAWPGLEHDDNDSMVPTSSQVWGDVVHTAAADHLDILGHFSAPELEPPHFDWIRTGTGFRRPAFEAVWGDVVAYITEGLPQT